MMGLTGEKIEELLLEMEITGNIKQSGGVFTHLSKFHICSVANLLVLSFIKKKNHPKILICFLF